MNVAHHASYVAWLELARTEMLRNCGTAYADLERAGVLLMVVRLDIRYRRPAAYDDVLAIETRVDSVGRARLAHAYRVLVVESGGEPIEPRLAAEARVELACCGRDGRPRPLPESLAPPAKGSEHRGSGEPGLPGPTAET